MELTYIGLSEYYRKFIPRAKEKNYIWVISLIARYADAEHLYDKIVVDWASLNDLTNKKILFVFSSPKISRKASFFNIPGRESFVGEMCPFIELLNGQKIENNRGEFEYMYPNYSKINWKVKHSQSISEFVKAYNIPEEEIPCLFFWNVRNEKRKVIPLSQDTDVYLLTKDIINEVNDYYNKLEAIDGQLQKYRHIEMYNCLYKELDSKAVKLDSKQSESIKKILCGEQSYLSVKDQITDNEIKKDLKRINQWKRQFLTEFEKNEFDQMDYYYLKNAQQSIEKQVDSILDDIAIEKHCISATEKGKKMNGKNTKMFLSYSWKDDSIANDIYDYFKDNLDIELHRDKIDIGFCGSIKEYMQSIGDMDYTILLISDAYLKSENCMYEVLEVMRDRRYKDKIFPAVISTQIYSPIGRARYVKFWKEKFDELYQELREIEPHEMGTLGNDLKRLEDIKNNIATFLDTVADMNNPRISDVTMRIEDELKKKGFSYKEQLNQSCSTTEDIFTSLGIPKKRINSEPSELEINQFVEDGYQNVIGLLEQMCYQFQKEYSEFDIRTEKIDGRNVVFQFYRNGKLVKSIKVFLSSMFGSVKNLGISDNIMSFSGGTSWNEMYYAKCENGELKFQPSMSFTSRGCLLSEKEVVKDIWTNHIQLYLER